MDTRVPFYQLIRTACNAQKINQKELSQKTGIRESALSHYFTGLRQPTLQNFYLICDALGLDTNELLKLMYKGV